LTYYRKTSSRKARIAVSHERASLSLPLRAAAVHNTGVLVSVKLEEPERIGGVPVVLVAVEDDSGVVGDTATGHQALEAGLVDEVAAYLILLVGMPVDLDGAGDMTRRLIEQHVLVRLDEADRRVVQVFGDPLGRYQRLRMRVAFSHTFTPALYLSWSRSFTRMLP